MAFEVQVFASQRVVEVDSHMVVGNLEHLAIEALALFVLQGQHSTREHILMVEVAVDGKDLALQVYHALSVVVAISLTLGEGKVELSTLLQSFYLFLEILEGEAKSGDEQERLLFGSLFH